MASYSPDALRVCEYLQTILKGQVGCGDDPVGFLIASHATLGAELKKARAELAKATRGSSKEK